MEENSLGKCWVGRVVGLDYNSRDVLCEGLALDTKTAHVSKSSSRMPSRMSFSFRNLVDTLTRSVATPFLKSGSPVDISGFKVPAFLSTRS